MALLCCVGWAFLPTIQRRRVGLRPTKAPQVLIGWAFLPTNNVVWWVSNPPTTPIGVAICLSGCPNCFLSLLWVGNPPYNFLSLRWARMPILCHTVIASHCNAMAWQSPCHNQRTYRHSIRSSTMEIATQKTLFFAHNDDKGYLTLFYAVFSTSCPPDNFLPLRQQSPPHKPTYLNLCLSITWRSIFKLPLSIVLTSLVLISMVVKFLSCCIF